MCCIIIIYFDRLPGVVSSWQPHYTYYNILSCSPFICVALLFRCILHYFYYLYSIQVRYRYIILYTHYWYSSVGRWMAGEIFLFSTVVVLVRRFNGFFRMCAMRFVLFVLFTRCRLPQLRSVRIFRPRNTSPDRQFVTMASSHACAADLLTRLNNIWVMLYTLVIGFLNQQTFW